MRVSIEEYKKLNTEITKLKRQSHGWHVMYKDAVVEIAALDAENTALKLRIETLE